MSDLHPNVSYTIIYVDDRKVKRPVKRPVNGKTAHLWLYGLWFLQFLV